MAALTVTTTVVKSATSQPQSGVLGSGVTATAGQYIYLDNSVAPAVIRLSGAGGTAAQAAVNGCLLTGGTAGQTVLYVSIDNAFVPGITGMTASNALWLSVTSGSITATYADLTTGNYVNQIGQVVTATSVNFSPLNSPVQK